MDETYVKIRGKWRYLYRAVDKDGNTIDFLLPAHRDKAAALRYFEKAIAQNGEPETVTIDKSGSNLAALQELNADRETPIRIRQNKYLNNVVEQDHRAIKRRTRPMLGFKNFRCARIILGGIEFMHMIVKGQMEGDGIGRTPRRAILFVGNVSTPHHINLIASTPLTRQNRNRYVPVPGSLGYRRWPPTVRSSVGNSSGKSSTKGTYDIGGK